MAFLLQFHRLSIEGRSLVHGCLLFLLLRFGLMNISRLFVRLSAISLVFLIGIVGWWEQTERHAARATGLANPKHLQTVYQRWQARYARADGARQLILPLHAPKSSSHAIPARGEVRIDLLKGAVTAQVTGLDPEKMYRLWLVTGQTGSTAASAMDLGALSFAGGRHRFTTQLMRERLVGMHLQRVVLTEATASPDEILLSGAPDLLQKIYYANKPWSIARVGNWSQPDSLHQTAPLFAFLLPQPAFAADEARLDDALAQQVARGREIFLKETFNGNGRTCATCHREDNNHTIDPLYIAELPDDDPLFVHEREPALTGLENAKLLRQLGLFLVHINGFDKPPVFRSAPHLLALNTSLIPEPDKEGRVVTHALGWSADGSPEDGSLRLFAVGAIVQHFPKTLQREPGVDFRLPTEEELDALEAYILSLGRDSDPDLDKNFGFIDGRAVQIDIGRFTHNPVKMKFHQRHVALQKASSPPVNTQGCSSTQVEIPPIKESFRTWLSENYPVLYQHFDSEYQALVMSSQALAESQ